tara:strand:+ start:296 stop:454 length:159 start_codon:yes stop_codon:yes gene_type:complete
MKTADYKEAKEMANRFECKGYSWEDTAEYLYGNFPSLGTRFILEVLSHIPRN